MNGNEIDVDNWRPVKAPIGDYDVCLRCGAMVERSAVDFMAPHEAAIEAVLDVRVDREAAPHRDREVVRVTWQPRLTHQAWHQSLDARS